MHTLLEELNEDQRKVVLATHGPVLVLAGAGSGKTRALTHRIAYMIEEGIARPEQILAVTFTNKAAAEMRERVQQLLGGRHEAPRGLSTFHSLGAKILRERAKYLLRSPGFTICDTDDSLRLIRQALDDLQISRKEFSAKQLRHRISSAKNHGDTPRFLAEQASNKEEEVLASVYARYEKLLARNDAYDFDDLLLVTLSLLEKEGAVRAHYQELWQFVSVDEYQDTNSLQDRLLKYIVGARENICVVGDDYQAIYSWRGARVDHILTFEKRYPECEQIYLTQNYRSTPAILEAANKVIAENVEQKHKKLWTAQDAQTPVSLFSFYNNQQEASWIRRQIEEYADEGGKRSDCVILYRTNAQSRALEEEFLTHQIPYTIVGGFRFYERKEIKDALALLQFWVNPSSSLAMRRVADVLWPGVGPKTMSKWEQKAAEGNSSLYAVLQNEAERKPVISTFVATYADKKARTFQSVSDLLSHLLTSSGYLKWLRAQPDGDERLENIEELLTVTAPFADPQAFLEEAALLSDIDSFDAEQDRVTCMTLHASKGLEFKNVIVIGCEEGLLPHENSLDSRESIEEERRLFYVGMTRAKEKLTLTLCKSRFLHGEIIERSPSRFLQNLPAGVERHDDFQPTVASTGAVEDSSFDDFGLLQAPDEEPVVTPYESGDFVKHATFGRGVVIDVKGSALVCVFDGVGVKTIDVESVKIPS